MPDQTQPSHLPSVGRAFAVEAGLQSVTELGLADRGRTRTGSTSGNSDSLFVQPAFFRAGRGLWHLRDANPQGAAPLRSRRMARLQAGNRDYLCLRYLEIQGQQRFAAGLCSAALSRSLLLGQHLYPGRGQAQHHRRGMEALGAAGRRPGDSMTAADGAVGIETLNGAGDRARQGSLRWASGASARDRLFAAGSSFDFYQAVRILTILQPAEA